MNRRQIGGKTERNESRNVAWPPRSADKGSELGVPTTTRLRRGTRDADRLRLSSRRGLPPLSLARAPAPVLASSGALGSIAASGGTLCQAGDFFHAAEQIGVW